MSDFEKRLVLASFSQLDMKFFFGEMKQLRLEKPSEAGPLLEGGWPPGLFAYVGFGTTDNVFIAKDEPSWEQLKGWFNKLGIRPGYERSRSGGWTNLYTCNLSSPLFTDNGNHEKCKLFGYLILLRPESSSTINIEFLLDFLSSHVTDRSPLLWNTDGYYKWALLVDMISPKNRIQSAGQKFSTIFSLLSWLRKKGVQTYTIPLGSQLWTSDNHYASLLQENPKKALVHVEANVEPGKEIEASKILCQAIRRSQYPNSAKNPFLQGAGVNMAWLKQVWDFQEPHFSIGSTPPCYLKSFHPSHGTKDVVLSGNFPVFLGAFIKNIWEARAEHDFIKTTRTYLPKDFIWTDYPEAAQNCAQCDTGVFFTFNLQKMQQSAQTHQIGNLPNIPKSINQGSNNAGVQEEPAKPFNVKDLVCGRDWSARLEFIRNVLVPDIRSTYEKMKKYTSLPDLKIHVWGKSGAQRNEVRPSSMANRGIIFPVDGSPEIVEEHELDIFLCHADLASSEWEIVVWHELVLAAFRSMLNPINIYLDASKRHVPDITDNEYPPPQFFHTKEDLFWLVWKTLGEPLGTAIGMYKKKYSLSTYMSKVLQNQSDSMSMQVQDYSNRLITAQFILNKLTSDDKNDVPGPQWLTELKAAYDTLIYEMPKQCEKWGVEWNSQRIRNILLGELNFFGFNATAKNRYAMAIQIAWTCAITFGHLLFNMIQSDSEVTEGKSSVANVPASEDRHDHEENFQSMLKSPYNALGFFRSLMIDEDIFLDSLNAFKIGDKVQTPIEKYMSAYVNVEHGFDCLIHRKPSTASDFQTGGTETGKQLPLRRRKFKVSRRWKGLNDPVYTAWQQLDYFDAMDFGRSERELENLTRIRKTDQLPNGYHLIDITPTCVLENFHKATNKGEFQVTGGELMGQFQIASINNTKFQIIAQLTDRESTIRFPKMLHYFTNHAIYESPFVYSPLATCKRMDLELICIQGALDKLQSIDHTFSKGDFISFNITPWIFDSDFNPWVDAFSDIYVQTASKLCEQILLMGCMPIVEIMEGKLPENPKAPFWSFLKNLNLVVAGNQNDGSVIGVAIDDQYGDGTDLRRLKVAAENAIAAAKNLQISQLLIKIDFKALLTILGVNENTKIQDLKSLTSHFKEAFSLIGHLTHHTIHTLEAFKQHGHKRSPALTIVFEGYSGEDGWEEELVSAFKENIRNAIRGAFGNSRLSLGQILVQGRD